MRLILGDLHLLNEANDRYNRVIPMISDTISQFGLDGKIDAVDLVGDILDCEYVTFKRITYFSFIMDLISEKLSNNIRLLIGNHDKYFKNDQHNENIISYIKFDGKVIDSPMIIDRILYVPHYYNRDNFPIGLLDPNDFDVILGHFGLEFINGMEELTIEVIQKSFPGKTIISGHIHNMDLNFEKNSFMIGSLKSESWKEQSPVYSVGLLDNNEPSFIVFPYHKIHMMVDVNTEDQFRKELLELFKRVHYHNSYFCWYNKDGELNSKISSYKYITSMINLKLKIFDSEIKKRDVDLVIDYCKHEIDDPAFMNLAIKTIYQIENGNKSIDSSSQQDVFNIDKQVLSDQRIIVNNLIDDIKTGNKLSTFSNNKKFIKLVESVSDGEMELFSEFLVVSGKSKEFDELIKMIG